MNIYAGLLFNQGYISDPELARALAGTPRPAPGPASPPASGEGTDSPGHPGHSSREGHRRRRLDLQAALLAAFR
jgi:hypothetical protein